MLNRACSGKGHLSRGSFLAIAGDADLPPKVSAMPTMSEEKKQKVLEVLANNGGKVGRASVVLGVSVSSIKRWVAAWVEEQRPVIRPPYTSPTRRFYESVRNPWSVTSFDPEKREVCLEIKNPSCTVNLGYTIPSWKSEG